MFFTPECTVVFLSKKNPRNALRKRWREDQIKTLLRHPKECHLILCIEKLKYFRSCYLTHCTTRLWGIRRRTPYWMKITNSKVLAYKRQTFNFPLGAKCGSQEWSWALGWTLSARGEARVKTHSSPQTCFRRRVFTPGGELIVPNSWPQNWTRDECETWSWNQNILRPWITTPAL
jgi:hypothetical protein